MSMLQRPLQLARTIVVAGSLSAAACNPYACSYETRFVGTTGTSSSANGTLIVTSLNFRQFHDDGPVPSDLTWNIRGEGLASPATSLTFQTASGQSVMPLSMSSTSSVSMTANNAATITGADRDRMYDLLGSGTVVVVLTLQNGTTITAPVHVASQDDWHHPDCD